MSQEILVNITPREVRVALLESSILQEIYIERSLHQGLLGNIYKGRVNRLLPGIQAAFVDIGLDRSAFLHVSDMTVQDHAPHVYPDIRELLVVGQEILVQVYKDPLGSKGARLTTQFTIPSRYLVLTPQSFHVAVSQRIVDETERQRLLAMTTAGEQGGFIFRTAAEGAKQAEIDADKIFLNTLWSEVVSRTALVKPTEMVYEEIPIVLRVLRDMVGYEVEKIRVDHQVAVSEMKAFAERYVPALAERIEYYHSDRPLFDVYGVENELQKSLERKVPLKSGGHIVIDQTEAMTTIDVNTGSYSGSSHHEQTIFTTNLEAIDVIARQVRLRNLGGIIIIDFIDMTDPAHQEHLLQSLKSSLAKDSAKIQVSELSSLGLVQMTRKRTRESLEHILCAPCPLCHKRGSIKSLETVCYEVFRELKRIAHNYPWTGYLVIASPQLTNELLNEESTLLAELEAELKKPIKLQAEASYTQERYDILPLSERIEA